MFTKFISSSSFRYLEDDPVILADWSDKLYEFFKFYTLKKLPGIGHFVPFEAPEEVVSVVKEALKN